MAKTTVKRPKRNGAAAKSKSKPVSIAQIAPDRAAALDLLHRGGRTLVTTIAGEAFELKPMWPLGLPRTDNQALQVSVGDTAATLVVPGREIEAALIRFAPEIRVADFPPAQRALLLEAALEPEIGALEALLEAPLRLRTIDEASPDHSVDFGFRIKGERGSFTAGFADMETRYLERIASCFSDAAQPIEQPLNIELPLRFFLDAVTLALRDIRSLGAGDVVMLDHQDGAFLMVSDRLVVPVSIADRRATLTQNPISIENSQWNWMVTEMPASTPDLENGTVDDLPVTLFFEVARKTVAISDLKTLSAGAVIDLPEGTRETISLVVNGKRIGEGELVRIGEGLGVRILSTSANA